MLKVYEITGANGLPYKVQLSPAVANKLGAVEVKDGTPAPAEAPAQKKAGTRAKSASTASK